MLGTQEQFAGHIIAIMGLILWISKLIFQKEIKPSYTEQDIN